MIFRFWSRQYVRHLETEIEWLRLEMRKEKQRADDAVSTMLALKTGGTVALPPRPLIADTERSVEQELADLQQHPEWANAGV